MQQLQEIKPATGFDRVMYPGQPGNEKYNQSAEKGVEIPESIMNYLESDEIFINSYEGLGAFAN